MPAFARAINNYYDNCKLKIRPEKPSFNILHLKKKAVSAIHPNSLDI